VGVVVDIWVWGYSSERALVRLGSGVKFSPSRKEERD